MSQSNSLYSKAPSFPKNPSSNITKNMISEWVCSLLKDDHHKIAVEQLGDGQVYCRIINHYAPGTISINRIVNSPRNQYEFMLNLKQFQSGLCKLKINIHFDIQKISKKKFNQNWALACQLYKYLELQEIKKNEECRKQTEQPVFKGLPLQASSKINQIEIAKSSIPQKVSFFKFSQNYPRGSLLFAVDKVKEILLANTHDTEKIRQIKVFFGLQSDIKIEDSQNNNTNSIHFV